MKLFVSSLGGVGGSVPPDYSIFPIADDGWMYVLYSGQSNAFGRYPDDIADINFRPGDKTEINGDVYVEDGTGGWKKAVLEDYPFSTTANNIFYSFLRELVANYPLIKVRLMNNASGGKGIEEWLTTGVMRPILDSKLALYDSADIRPFGLWLWHQGEANDGGYTGYRDLWIQVRDEFLAGGILDADFQFVCGEIVERQKNVNGAFKLIADLSPNYTWAKNQGYESYDKLHFMGNSLVDFGVNYYNRWIENITGAGRIEDDTMPTKPIVTASNVTTSGLRLSWTESTPKAGLSISGYKVYANSGMLLHQVLEPVTFSVDLTYNDFVDLPASWVKTDYEYFSVAAFDNLGNHSIINIDTDLIQIDIVNGVEV